MSKAIFIPLRDLVVFPNIIMPLYIGRNFSKKALDNIIKSKEREFVVCAQKNSDFEHIDKNSIADTGVYVKLLQFVKLPDGNFKILIEGKHKVKIKNVFYNDEYYEVEYQKIRKSVVNFKTEHLFKYVMDLFANYTKLEKKIPEELVKAITQNREIEKVIDLVSAHILIRPEEKQTLLDQANINKLLEKMAIFLEQEIQILNIENKIEKDVRKKVNKQQKEFFLREQMKVIQEELGIDKISEIDVLKEKIKILKAPDYVRQKVNEELKKISRTGQASPEYHVILNYVDWILDLPWEKHSKDIDDIFESEKILAKSHYGLDKVKERIIEFIAVKKLKKNTKGPILCLVGPPGVGKTSLGESVAKALGREFVHFSLGGVKDEAEIRGHRQTYVGAMPGRILSLMRQAGTNNPVLMLDEIDKIESSFRGDPAAALLEILDPDHNKEFSDHYINMPFDLSKVLFITTANYMYDIPAPLLDRMEVIQIPGYTIKEKVNIAKKFLLPKQLKENGLKKYNVEISDKSLTYLVSNYTMEAGVRKLSNKIAAICRKIALKVLKENNKKLKVKISDKNIIEFLGNPVYKNPALKRKNEVGIARGLAWTQFGGDVLTIEVTLIEGDGKLILTGQLGDVMKESAQTALTYVKSQAKKLKIDKNKFKDFDIHVHVPEGAVPKDGPSAGITMTCALVSALTKRKFKKDIAMTGEITLRGKVLAIGGLKEKSLAAHMQGIKKIIIPDDNNIDLNEIDKDVKKEIEFLCVEDGMQVIEEALI